MPHCPYPCERDQRPVIIYRKPFWIFARHRISVLAERRYRHEAPIFRLEPSPPVRGLCFAYVGSYAGNPRSSRHSPSHHSQFAFAVAHANDGRDLIRKDRWQGWQIACRVTDNPEQIADRLLVRCHRVEIAHRKVCPLVGSDLTSCCCRFVCRRVRVVFAKNERTLGPATPGLCWRC